MFRCEFSNEVSLPGEKPVQVVISKRRKQYKPRYDVNRTKNKPTKWDKRDRRQEKDPSANDPGGEGWEITREIAVRPKYAKQCIESIGVTWQQSRDSAVYESSS